MTVLQCCDAEGIGEGKKMGKNKVGKAWQNNRSEPNNNVQIRLKKRFVSISGTDFALDITFWEFSVRYKRVFSFIVFYYELRYEIYKFENLFYKIIGISQFLNCAGSDFEDNNGFSKITHTFPQRYQSNDVICAEAYLGWCLLAIIICLISAGKINDAQAASKMADGGVPTPRPGVSISSHSLLPPTDRRPLDPQRINLDKPEFYAGLKKTVENSQLTENHEHQCYF